MDNETKLIVDAINEMGTVDVVKDYIFPLLIVLFGGFFAHFSTTYMRYLDAQKHKLEIANDWILGLQDAFHSLITIKHHYYGKVSEYPVERTGVTPEIIISAKPLNLPVNKLSFIIQSKEDFLENPDDFMSPAYISTLQTNYNLLLSALHERNVLAGQIIPLLGRHYSSGGLVIKANLEQIYKVVNEADYLGYVQLTEHLIKTTDELIIAIHNFLCEFPDICRYAIDTQRIKHYGKVIECYYDHVHLLEKSTPVNIKSLAKLFNVSEQNIREKFVSGYEGQSEPIIKTVKSIKNHGVNEAIEKNTRDIKIKKHHRAWWK